MFQINENRRGAGFTALMISVWECSLSLRWVVNSLALKTSTRKERRQHSLVARGRYWKNGTKFEELDDQKVKQRKTAEGPRETSNRMASKFGRFEVHEACNSRAAGATLTYSTLETGMAILITEIRKHPVEILLDTWVSQKK